MLAPRYHHFAPGCWINDPVGLHRSGELWVLHDQRSSGVEDRAIGWGRATSRDLLSWCDEGMAIAPEADEWIYSGCVVPHDGQAQAFFTLHRPSSGLQAQAEARWNGSWRRMPGELVPGRPESRDPFVFRWRDEWRMLLAQPPPWEAPERHRARLMLLRSDDLAVWSECGPVGPQSELGEMFETPLLRRIPCANAPVADWPWLLAVGVVDRRGGGAACGTRAWLGRFDGRAFAPDGDAFLLDYGPDFYAPAAWAGTPDDQVIITGWSNSWAYARRLPSEGWSGGAHALPRRLSAVREAGRWVLRQYPAALPPVGAAQPLGAGEHMVGAQCLLSLEGAGTLRLRDLHLELAADELALERSSANALLREAHFHGRWSAPRPEGSVDLLLDGCVAELFSANGAVWMSALTLRTAEDMLRLSDGLSVTLRPIG